ncbi:FAD-binding oxidoreductase [Streptomyces sp. L7]
MNEELGYAVVEPGVRFFDLYDHLRAHGYKLWPQMPDIAWGSVIGNTVDHGLGVCRPGQHADRACGMEVVLANGELLRTGMGAMPGSPSWHTYQRGFGPALDSLFMQSNFGIVTKMGVWLMPEPEVYRLGMINAEGEEGAATLIDGIRPFIVDGTIDGGLALSYGVDTQPLVELRDAVRRGDGPTAEEASAILMERVKENAGRSWNLRWAMYGSQEVIDAQWAHIQRGFEGVDGVEFDEVTYRGDEVHTRARNHAEKVSAGVANDELLALVDLWEGVGGHLDFFTGRAAQRR